MHTQMFYSTDDEIVKLKKLADVLSFNKTQTSNRPSLHTMIKLHLYASTKVHKFDCQELKDSSVQLKLKESAMQLKVGKRGGTSLKHSTDGKCLIRPFAGIFE